MATIKTSIQMFNGMTPGLRSMTNALNIAISSFETMQKVSANSIDTSSLQTARVELNRAEVAFSQVESSIREADQQQKSLNSSISRGTGLAAGFRGALAGIGGALGIKKIVNISDEFSRSTARLGLMTGSMENVAGLQDQIYQSAQRTRTSYLDTMDAVAKLGLRAGSVFKNSNETIAFVELLNKQFKIAGASQQEISSATLQLTQALGSGVLRGEEFNAVFEAAPNVMEAVAVYMDKPIGKLRELASDGEITASIVKNAMFAMAEEIEERFNQIPHTWSDVWVMAVNKVIKVSQPLLKVIGVLANNWSIIEPIILGVASALGIYLGYLGVYKSTQAIANGLQAVAAARIALKANLTLAEAAATTTATGAQVGLNAAILACPITWIILAVIALIAIFYAVIAAINKVKGTTYSATGFIVGAFFVAGAIIGNLFIGFMNLVVSGVSVIWNAIATFAEFFANVFDDPVASVARLFMGLFDTILSAVEGIAGALDTVFGSNMADAVNGFRSKLSTWTNDKFGEGKVKLERDVLGRAKRLNYGDSWNNGLKKGTDFANKISGIFGNNPMDDLIANTEDIAGNTGKIADSMEISQEELKYLRDMAEREAINRFTTAEIKVDFRNESTINSNLDIDGVVNKFTEVLREAVYTEAEEVHVLV